MLDNESTAATTETTAAKKRAKKKPAAKKRAKARAKSGSSAKGKGGKTSLVIWVDARAGAKVKAMAKKAGLTQADFMRKKLGIFDPKA